MQFFRSVLAFAFCVCASTASAADGLIAITSPYSANETMRRLEQQVTDRGLTIFARIDHAAGAASAGAELRPTVLLVFGNPKGGTPFMQCRQTVGIDLPLKVLVWEDASAQVWLAYNDPAFIARRHGVTDCPVVEKLGKALDAIAGATVAE
jgi:uncharacterized protein (DUF302 family)